MAKSQILALNFDNDSIKFIEFEKKKGINIIHKIGEKKLPENSCKDAYGIFDVEKVKEGLKELLKENNIKAKKSTYLIPEKSVIKKTTTVPKTSTDKEIHQLIKRNSKKYTGEFSGDVNFDFYIKEQDSKKKKDVYILTVKKDVIENRDNVLLSCGLDPQVADLPSSSLYRVNEYVRNLFYTENHQTLLEDEFVVFVKKENNFYNVMIFDKELKETLQVFKNNLQDLVDEMNILFEDNKIKNKFGGFAFFDFKDEKIDIEKDQYVFVSTLLNSKNKSKKEINLESQEWLALSGLTQRNKNEY